MSHNYLQLGFYDLLNFSCRKLVYRALSICPFGVFATKVIVITPTVLFFRKSASLPHRSDRISVPGKPNNSSFVIAPKVVPSPFFSGEYCRKFFKCDFNKRITTIFSPNSTKNQISQRHPGMYVRILSKVRQ